MGAAPVLSADPAPPREAPAAGCPRCGEPWSALPAVPAASLGGAPVRRCAHCGTRGCAEPPRLVFSCESCGLPFLAGDLLARTDQRCEDCRTGRIPEDLPDPALASAVEAEVRAALAGTHRFLTSETVGPYLDRIARQSARRVEGSAEHPRVLVVDEDRLWTLALPSGLLLVSRGALASVEDEAELTFLLAHELAHATSGDAAVRLVRLGFHAVSRGTGARTPARWAEGAEDLVRLGYGRRRERDADERAFGAVLALGYDPESIFRWLNRLERRTAAGDPLVAEVSVAHPSPADRVRRLERAFYGRVPEGGAPAVNREVFRRAAGPDALAGLVPAALAVPTPARTAPGARDEDAPRGGGRRWLWVAAAVAAAAALAAAGLIAWGT